MTLEDIARAATGRHRFRAEMVMAFAVLALLLAMVGVFGILAYSVQQSVRDFGVRRALGATTQDVLRLVLTNALRVVGTGAAIGLVLAALFGRWLGRGGLHTVYPVVAGTVAIKAGLVFLIAYRSSAGVARGTNRSRRRASQQSEHFSWRQEER
jgi:putative ABC transport system permease protein